MDGDGKDKIVLDQSTEIFLSKVLRGVNLDKTMINVVNVGQVKVGGNGVQQSDLIEFLKTMPPPRLDNLMKFVVGRTLQEFQTQTKAAEFLGITKRQIGHWKRRRLLREDRD
jgi:hypothetical protein